MAESTKDIHREEDSYGNYTPGIQALFKSLHVAFIILAILIVGMLVWFITFEGSFTVKQQESVLVFQFGKFYKQYDEGWHWMLPQPVNQIVRIPTTSQSLVVSTFQPAQKADMMKDPEGNPLPTPKTPLKPGVDGYLISGDANIMHAEMQINYRIENPTKYYLNCLCPKDPAKADEEMINAKTGEKLGTRGPQTMLKAILENAVLKVTASEKIYDALYINLPGYRNKIEKTFEKMVAEMDIGIAIENVTFSTTAPPASTLSAFQEVTKSQQENSTAIKKAEAYMEKEKNDAIAKSAELIAQAQTYKKRIVSEVKSEKTYFEEILKEYKQNPETVLVTLYNKALSEAMTQVNGKYILNARDKGQQEVRIKINPAPRNYKKQEGKGNN
jgi:membrane protease subunit HflK